MRLAYTHPEPGFPILPVTSGIDPIMSFASFERDPISRHSAMSLPAADYAHQEFHFGAGAIGSMTTPALRTPRTGRHDLITGTLHTGHFGRQGNDNDHDD
jgi:hypothetical protein